MSNTEASILILTMHCNEPQLNRQISSLYDQDYYNWDHYIISDLSNLEAHKVLYQTIVNKKHDYTYFLKLDGDMVLTYDKALSDLVQFMHDRPNFDHVAFPLKDWLTGSLMPSVHIYSNKCYWYDLQDHLFVDPYPKAPGIQKLHHGHPAPFVMHMPDPTSEQAFMFGAHRALKLFQPQRAIWKFNASQAFSQFRILKAIWHHFEETKDRRPALALIAAIAVQQGKIGSSGNDRHDKNLYKTFKEYDQFSLSQLYQHIASFWDSSWHRHKSLIKRLGFLYFLKLYFYGYVKIMYNKLKGLPTYPVKH